ncbi:bacterial Ig-like domain-containing protein [Enterococcus faecalis]|uniref:bacterial Ig-like domain-containing protein n=2 Tax=Enterococcus faecalis TaxID=1351 RepID=UPI0026701524|nr:bacterial Ig-like domain-containing protein [Enterococcus faecalis]WHK20387.1 bacterial Ig-like domain-containing protein [Enterococcus faecalis]
MKKKVILLLFILIFSINQGQIAFAEIANVQTEEKIDNNTSNDTGFLPRIINPELYSSSFNAKFIDPYEIIIGDGFNAYYPIIYAKDEIGNDIDFSKIYVYWGSGNTPINPNIVGEQRILTYKYNYPDGSGGINHNVIIKVVGKDGRRAELKDTELYVGQKWDLGSIFKYVTDRDGYFINPEQINDVWIDGNKTKEIDTSRPGKHSVQIGVSSPRTRPLVYSNVGTVTVKEDQTKAELKDTELYVDQKWDLGSVFKNVVDKDGNPIKPEEVKWVWIDGNKTREMDTSKPGKHTVKIALQNAAQKWIYSNDVTVTVEDKTSIKTKNSTIYRGQGWGQIDNFVSATDEAGQNVPFQDGRIQMQGATAVEPSKPGVYKVTYIFNGKFKQVKSESTVTVKEDKTSIKTKDNTLYVGQKWDPKDNFVNATDEDGKSIPWNDPRITKNGASIDTSKPGKHKIKYTFKGKVKNVDSEFTVTVKEDKTSIKTKDNTLYVGQKWDPKDNFVNATDEDGKSIPWNDPRITKNGASIDTSKPGKHKIKYTFKGKVKNVDSEFTVIVKEEPFMLKHVSDFDFGEKELSLINKLVVNKKENPTIEVETPSIVGKDWQLQVELSPFLDKENSKSILKGVSLFIPKGKLESDLETEEPTQYDCQLEANGKASILMHGTKTKGKGRWKNKLATKGITLSIPPENKTGNYESTLHWTLLDVPG